MVTSSFADIAPDMCLGYRVIQQDSGPVLLVVNVTSDPCPQATWFRRPSRDSDVTDITGGASGITVS